MCDRIGPLMSTDPGWRTAVGRSPQHTRGNRIEGPHQFTVARTSSARSRPRQAPDQMGRRWHLGTHPCCRPGRSRCRGRHRLDNVGRLNRRPSPSARRRHVKMGASDRPEPADHALGRSRGSLSTKALLAADGRARPLAVPLTAGQAGDAPAFETLISRICVFRSGPGR